MASPPSGGISQLTSGRALALPFGSRPVLQLTSGCPPIKMTLTTVATFLVLLKVTSLQKNRKLLFSLLRSLTFLCFALRLPVINDTISAVISVRDVGPLFLLKPSGSAEGVVLALPLRLLPALLAHAESGVPVLLSRLFGCDDVYLHPRPKHRSSLLCARPAGRCWRQV